MGQGQLGQAEPKERQWFGTGHARLIHERKKMKSSKPTATALYLADEREWAFDVTRILPCLHWPRK
jgi:hypothetical protein